MTKSSSVLLISSKAAKVSLGAGIVFVILLALLHVIEGSEFNPLWRFMSEYSNGEHGWVMRIGFFMLALSTAAIVAAIRSQVTTRSGKVGLVLLGITVVGMTLAGCFNQDSILSKEVTTTGNLHGLATVLGIPEFSIGSLLVGVNLAKHNPNWAHLRRPLLWLSNAAWVSFVTMFVYMMIATSMNGGFGPNVWVGLFNRIFVATMVGWLIYVSYQALKLRKSAA